MLALKENIFNGAANPTEFYNGECIQVDWLEIAQEKKEERYRKVKSLRHMRRYTTANFLGRLAIAISDSLNWLFREKGKTPSPV